MMKLVIALFISLTLSPILNAKTFQASSLRTASGTIIHVGDSYLDLITRIEQSPNAMTSHTFKENQKQYLAMRYVYEIDGRQFVFTVVNDQITHIEWISLDL